MAELYIFDKDDNFLNILSKETGLIDTWFKDYQNHIPDEPFVFYIKNNSPLLHLIIEENQVAFYDRDNDLRLMRMKEVYEVSSDEGYIVTVKCEPSFLELYDHFIEDKRIFDGIAQEALNKALQGSRYIGEVTVDLGTATDNFYWTNGIEAIFKILNTWGGALKDTIKLDNDNEIIERKILILERLGKDSGIIVEPGYNAEQIQRKTLSYPVTALWAQGASLETDNGGYTRYITFADVEWKKLKGDPVDKPKGQKWVGDPQALQKYGYLHNGVRKHRFGHFSNQDYDNPKELLKAAWESLQEQTNPEITHEATIDVKDRHVSLGDTATILDRNYNKPIELQSQVTGLEYDILDMDRDVKIIVGKYVDMSENPMQQQVDDLENTISQSRPKWDQADKPINKNKYPDIKPNKPINVTATGAFETIQLYWDYTDEIYVEFYEVYGSQVSDFVPDSQHLLYRGKVSAFGHKVNTDEKWYYYVRAVNYHGRGSDFSDRVEASTVRVISDDILFGSILAEHLTDNLDIADKLAQNTIDRINQGPMQAIQYTQEEIEATENSILEQLNNEIGDVNGSISNLDTVANDLKLRADDTDLLLAEHGNKFTNIETNIDTIEGSLSANINKVQRIDGTVQSHSNTLTAHAEQLNAKLDSLTYARDKTGILSSIEKNTTDIEATAKGLELRVTKEEFDAGIDEVDSRISKTEATLITHADQITAKASKSDLLKKVDTSVYNEKVGQLTTSINGISGRVSNTETNIDNLTGDLKSAKSQIASIDVDVKGIKGNVTNISSDLNHTQKQVGQLEVKYNEVSSTVSNIRIGGRNLLRYTDFSKKENTDRWIEIGNANFITPRKFDGFPRYFGYISVGTSPVGYNARIRTQYNVSLVKGRTYTLSWLGATSDFVNSDFNYTGILNNKGLFELNLSSKIKKEKIGTATFFGYSKSIYKYSVTFAFNGESLESYSIMLGSKVTKESAPWIAITDVMLEHGTMAGDWDISPEDTDQRMSIAESSITQLSDDILLKVDEDGVIASINVSPEGIRIDGNRHHITGQTLIDDAVIGTAAIADMAVTRAKLGTAVVGTAQIEDAAITNAKIKSVSADKVSATSLSSISANLGTVRSGRMLSQNSNWDLNMNTGYWKIQNMNLKVGNGAMIEFTDVGNRIQYRSVDDGIVRSSGMGVGKSTSGLPFSYVGTTGNKDLDTLSEYYSGAMFFTTRAISEGAYNNISGFRFALRNKAVGWDKGLYMNWEGSKPSISTYSPSNYDYEIGTFARMTTKQNFGIVNYNNDKSGWLLETYYAGNGTDITLRGTYGADYNYAIGENTSTKRIRNIFLKNNPVVASDERLKEEIKNINIGLDLIKDIDAKSFRLKPTKADVNNGVYRNKKQFGVIAQQIISVFNKHGFDTSDLSMISGSKEDTYSVQYEQFIPLLIKSTQELDTKVTNNADDINLLKIENQYLKQKVKILEEKIA